MASPSLPRYQSQPNQPRQGGAPAAAVRKSSPALRGTPPHAVQQLLTPPVSFNDHEGQGPAAPWLELGLRGGQNDVSKKPARLSGGSEAPHSSRRGEPVMSEFGSRMSEGGRSEGKSDNTFLSRVSSRLSGTGGSHTGTSLTGSNGSRGQFQGRHTPSQGSRTPESRTPRRQVSDGPQSQPTGAGIGDSTTDQRMMAMLEMLADCNFLVQSDSFITCGTKFLSVLFLAGATAFAYLALQPHRGYKFSDNVKPFVYVTGALVMMLMALCSFLRVCSPTSLNIARINGDWCLILQRMAMKPVVKPLRSLEAFVETFGFGSRAQLGFWGKMYGHSTCRKGTLHLFFPENDHSNKAVAICCSLENAKEFFIRLRDLMIASSHHLSSITADYVMDWDQ